MSSHQLSSGDVLADRRADYARMLGEGGDVAGAAELMEQALELVPCWAAGWFRRGEYLEKAGDREQAVAAYERAVALDPADIFGAGLKLAFLGARAAPDHPPSRYVERLFDDYARRFDKALVERLGYSVPEKLAALLRGTGRHFGLGVDLGCGTGLFGAACRDLVDRLEGYDLSANMLKEAADKRLYAHLARADLSLDAGASGLFGDGFCAGRADLVSAADVLMYLGDLNAPFALARMLSKKAGSFAFSVEDAGTDAGYRLVRSLRYAHSAACVRDRLAAHGFRHLAEERTVIRQDGGRPVQGILYLAEAIQGT